MNSDVFSGCIPALMTPCNTDRTPNFDALIRKGQELIAAGMSAVVYCGSMGDWPLLSDAERQHGAEALVEAGVPVIVGTGAQNPAKATDHPAHAQKCGANGLMVIPRVLSRGTSVATQRAHFAGILDAAGELPAVIYNSPIMASRRKPNCSSIFGKIIPISSALRSLVGLLPCGMPPNISPVTMLPLP